MELEGKTVGGRLGKIKGSKSERLGGTRFALLVFGLSRRDTGFEAWRSGGFLWVV